MYTLLTLYSTLVISDFVPLSKVLNTHGFPTCLMCELVHPWAWFPTCLMCGSVHPRACDTASTGIVVSRSLFTWIKSDRGVRLWSGLIWLAVEANSKPHSLTLTLLLVQIHATFRYTTRWKNAACTCAIAVREGNDAVGVDICRNKLDIVQYSPTLSEGTTIVRNDAGTKFYVS